MVRKYNLDETIAEGDPLHPETHEAIAEAVNDLDDRAATVETIINTGRLSPTELTRTIVDEVVPTATAWAAADAFVDFTVQGNGAPATKLDTGQAVDYVLQNVSGRQPVISGGKLVHGSNTGTGSYANYYQSEIDGDLSLFGTTYVVDAATGSTAGIMCLAAWARVFEAGDTIPPRTPGHITINTVTNTWEWWVSDGLGTGASNLKSVKQGTFTPPAKDGAAVWETACLIDADNGIGYLLLPGPDATTGKRVVTLTNAEIAAFLTAVSLTPRTFSYLLDGARVLLIEHFATAAANTAIYPMFLSAFGEAKRLARAAGRMLRSVATATPQPSYVRLNPTSMVTDDAGTSSASIAGTAFSATYGPTGKIIFEVVGWYEFTRGADTVFMRMVVGSGNTTLEAATIGAAGEKKTVTKRIEASGGTPGATVTCTLQHSSVSGNADLLIGGSGGTMRPGLYVTATPL